MNILYVLNSGKPGGMERHVQDLVSGMVKRGHKVYVWCVAGEVVNWFESAGAEVTTREIVFEFDLSYINSLKKFLRQNRIDVIHAHEPKAGVHALLAGWSAGTKVKISHIHTPMTEWQVAGSVKKIYTHIEIHGYALLVNRFSDAEIALTPSKKKMKIAEGIKPKKLVILPNGLDVKELEVPQTVKQSNRYEIMQRHRIIENTFIIGNVSRISKEKGHPILLKAFKKFLDSRRVQNINFHLMLAGGGPLEEDIKSEINDLGLRDYVTVTGIFPDSDRIKYYNAMNLFVFPTLAEGFGLVMVEAVASGLNVICTDLEVLKEVSGEKLVYFKAGDYVDLSNKMSEVCYAMLTNPDYSQNAKEFITNNYSMDKFISGYEDLYKRFLDK